MEQYSRTIPLKRVSSFAQIRNKNPFFKEFNIHPGDTISFIPPYSKEVFTGVLQNDGRVVTDNGLESNPNWERLQPSDLTVIKVVHRY